MSYNEDTEENRKRNGEQKMLNAQGLLQNWTDRTNADHIGFQFEIMDTMFVHVSLVNHQGPHIEPGTGWAPRMTCHVSTGKDNSHFLGEGFHVLHSMQGSNVGKWLPIGEPQEMPF